MSSILDEQLRFMALEQNGLMKSILTLGISERDLTLMVDCKINPNAVRTKKDQLPLKWCLPQTHLLVSSRSLYRPDYSNKRQIIPATVCRAAEII